MSVTEPVRLHQELERIWRTPRGLGQLSAVNHTVIGRRFIVAAFVFFAIGGVLSMLIRAQLASPHSAFVGPELYNQIFTMHGTVMMFLFAIPMFEGLAMYFLPKMMGARDLAFPRMSAYGFWCYVFGGSILIVAMMVGVAPDSGWFMYTPLSSGRYSPGINADVWLLGITFVEISAMAAAVELTVSILKVRAPGMSLARMPIFAWYILITAGMMLVGFPPLILGSILLEMERAFDLPFFDPTRGGDALLWQHLFWLFGHPEVYIIFLPAAGMISTILPVLVGHRLLGYSWIVVSVTAMGFLSFGLWVHHMFTVGIPHLAQAFFSAASVLVAVPTGVQIFLWIGTMMAGRPRLSLPMLYLIGFFVVFVCGGLTGVMLAIVPFDWQAHDTHFVVAHMHYVLVGGFVFPMLAAAYFYLPHFSGRMPLYGVGHVAFWLIFVGFNLTFLIMHLTGLLGMPRRYYTYESGYGWDWLNLVSSIGGFITTMGFALVAFDFIFQFRYGRIAPRNPWKSGGLEWATATPPPSYGFASLPMVEGRDPLFSDPETGRKLASGQGYLAIPRNDWQETLVVEMATGRAQAIQILPQPTFLPLWTAVSTGVFVLSLLFKVYPLSIAAIVSTLGLLLLWTRATGATVDRGELDAGHGLRLPIHPETSRPLSWWGMTFVLLADATMFASLLFGALFLWLVAPSWPPPLMTDLPATILVAAAAALLVAVGGAAFALRSLKKGSGLPGMIVAVAGSAGATALLGWLVWQVPEPTSHAHLALTAAILTYLGFHAAVGLVFALFGLWRIRAGIVSARRSADLSIGALWHGYTAATGIIGLAFVAIMPWLAAVERVAP
ncbi:cytochrome c oxidase subunit I [Aureimonas phyllosphaerae]|uniref:cytochrome-c oxidase n=1 Tax=Aureimonas phyllosphaerae TaxID=1166078 RepID=A0A7W6BRG1_9HYPH|nr:cytochrome c oxidase subunit I [Aureimonas phyllosphaerae]MBB3935527.1 cytochrome c oxidase subunit I+III [Aureimonas phyllosphaerae]MBB3959535.1 cytochrome c oxidase subunit I+III [Aureimonas phyllosphaerae]SFF11811.1 cytochrome c oxidase subunit I+III [Aureimonas phyllosphaerae]